MTAAVLAGLLVLAVGGCDRNPAPPPVAETADEAGRPDPLSPLLEQLQSDGSSRRIEAARQLADTGDMDAYCPLVTLAVSDADPEVRRQAALAATLLAVPSEIHGRGREIALKRSDLAERLSRTVEPFDLRDIPLSDIFQYVCDVTGWGSYVNWNALEAAGIDMDNPMDLVLPEMTTAELFCHLAGRLSTGEIKVFVGPAPLRLNISTVEDIAGGIKARRAIRRFQDARRRFVQAHASETARQGLSMTVDAADFRGVPLNDVLRWIAEHAGVELEVDWALLTEAGIEPSTPVTLNLADCALQRILATVLDDVGGGSVHIDWLLEGETLTITTHKVVARRIGVEPTELRGHPRWDIVGY
ncbi:MAG: hypothetical protein GVY16_02365 [Planctomycetes bacterium]|nr:hypothetical protein [Planctomycetota bacterium]